MNQLDPTLFERLTPWAACASLEEFFAAGGRCSFSGETNWTGVAGTCARKANSSPVDLPDAAEVLGWAHLAIAINESLGTIWQAMWVRISMIIRFGHHSGDRICDMDKVVDYCMSIPEVRRLMEKEPLPRSVLDIAPDARVAAQMLAELEAAGKLQPAGDVSQFLNIVKEAQITTSD